MDNVEHEVDRAPDSSKSELATIGNSETAELKHVSLQMPQKERDLHLAIKANDREGVENLIRAGADINYLWNEERCMTNTPLLSAVYRNNVEITMTLLKAGADINKTDESGWTPLLVATYFGHPVLVDILIQTGADVNKASNDGLSPLFCSVLFTPSVAMVEKLLAVGARVNQVHRCGQTPLHMAAQYWMEDMLRTLASPLSVNSIDNMGRTPLYIFVTRVCRNKLIVEDFLSTVKILFHAQCDMLNLNDFLKWNGYRIPHELLADDEALFEWYTKSFNSPHSMKNLCRRVIQKILFDYYCKDFVKPITYLPLPAKLQAYLSRKLLWK